jgi:hypothetical protein
VNKYVVKASVRNADGSTGTVSVPVEASSAGAAKQIFRADLDRQVAAGTLISYTAPSVRHAKK